MKKLQNFVSVRYDRAGRYAVTNFELNRAVANGLTCAVEVQVFQHDDLIQKEKTVLPLRPELDSLGVMLDATAVCLSKIKERQECLLDYDERNILACVKESTKMAISDGRFSY